MTPIYTPGRRELLWGTVEKSFLSMEHVSSLNYKFRIEILYSGQLVFQVGKEFDALLIDAEAKDSPFDCFNADDSTVWLVTFQMELL